MPSSRSIIHLLLVALAASALVVAGCGEDSSAPAVDTAGLSPADAAAKVATESMIAQVNGDGEKACASMTDHLREDTYDGDACPEKIATSAKEQAKSFKLDTASVKARKTNASGGVAMVTVTFAATDAASGKTVKLETTVNVIKHGDVWLVNSYGSPRATSGS
jgi:hypothetical protein